MLPVPLVFHFMVGTQTKTGNVRSVNLHLFNNLHPPDTLHREEMIHMLMLCVERWGNLSVKEDKRCKG